jgi:6-pyruvoyltetrahydropterin/6-carboxytetrahydropterin synthase
MSDTTSETRIAKDFRWEMAHRLPFHAGLCRNLHGHSYKARVEITGIADDYGMVLDYYDMKRIINPIIERLDHSFLCDTHDIVMVEFFRAHPMKVNYIDVPSTAENIAWYILREVRPLLVEYAHLRTVRVRVHETDNTFAEVEQILR